MKKLIISGKRKTSVAKASIQDGKGIISFNKQPISFLPRLRQLEIYEPLVIAKNILGELKFDISLNIRGGGWSSQTDVARLTIAKAIVAFTENPEVKRAFLSYDRNLLVADNRRKEARKPGDSKARARRQTSYR